MSCSEPRASGPVLKVLPARVEFEAQEDVYLAPGKETNMFRGALGLALRQVCCPGKCQSASTCAERRTCTYARFFEPLWEDGPSQYRDAPRPFVLRMAEAEGRIRAGGVFGADLFLFDCIRPPWVELTRAFAVAGAAGLGPTRGRARFRGVKEGEWGTAVGLPVRGEERGGRIRVRFVTPTELKSEGEVRAEPDFETLIHRLVERVWALGRLYQGWGEWDYRDLLDLARMVKVAGWEWDRSDAVRRSSRTGQRHSIGGFRGWAEYEGPVGVFLPLLEIARWSGVGRQTVWGKGEIRVEEVWLK